MVTNRELSSFCSPGRDSKPVLLGALLRGCSIAWTSLSSTAISLVDVTRHGSLLGFDDGLLGNLVVLVCRFDLDRRLDFYGGLPSI